MTNALNLIHTDLFHGSPVNIYENTSNEIFMTARQLATCLEYSRKSQFEKLLSHHPELRENEFSLLATIPVPQTLAYSKAKGLSQQIFVNRHAYSMKTAFTKYAHCRVNPELENCIITLNSFHTSCIPFKFKWLPLTRHNLWHYKINFLLQPLLFLRYIPI